MSAITKLRMTKTNLGQQRGQCHSKQLCYPGSVIQLSLLLFSSHHLKTDAALSDACHHGLFVTLPGFTYVPTMGLGIARTDTSVW